MNEKFEKWILDIKKEGWSEEDKKLLLSKAIIDYELGNFGERSSVYDYSDDKAKEIIFLSNRIDTIYIRLSMHSILRQLYITQYILVALFLVIIIAIIYFSL